MYALIDRCCDTVGRAQHLPVCIDVVPFHTARCGAIWPRSMGAMLRLYERGDRRSVVGGRVTVSPCHLVTLSSCHWFKGESLCLPLWGVSDETCSICRARLIVPAWVAGLLVVIIGFTGSLVLVVPAAEAAELTPEQMSSWVLAIAVGSGLATIILSLIYRQPVLTAWSTPGLVLLATSLGRYSLERGDLAHISWWGWRSRCWASRGCSSASCA